MSELQTVVRVYDLNDNPAELDGRSRGRRSAATLDHLPDGLIFPDGLRDRLSFDREHKEIVYSGYMSSADYYFLLECSDDPEYRRAVDELHHQAAFEPLGRRQLVPTWLWTLVTAVFVLAGLVWLCWLLGL